MKEALTREEFKAIAEFFFKAGLKFAHDKNEPNFETLFEEAMKEVNPASQAK